MKNFKFFMANIFLLTVLFSNTTVDMTTISMKERVVSPPEINGERSGDLYEDAEFLFSVPKYDEATPMDIAFDGEFYYMTSGGYSTDMYQMDADFNVTAVHFVDVDSRGVVQNPADGQLYMKNYYNGSFYRLNTDPFDGSVEYLYDLEGSDSQAQFAFSADGQSIFRNDYGYITEHSFATGAFINSFNIPAFGVGIAHTGDYLIVGNGGDLLLAYDENGDFVGEVNMNDDGCGGYTYGTPSYANGIAFTFNQCNWDSWYAYQIDDGVNNDLGCTDPYACNYDSDAIEDDGSCAYEYDCFDECGGDAVTDDCGICDGNNESMDDCGICDGDNSECTGCSDPEALNYDSDATIDGQCCVYYEDIPIEGLADLNNDGGVNVQDVVIMVNLILN